LESHRDVSLLEALAKLALSAPIGGRRFGRRRRASQTLKAGLSEPNDMAVFDRASGGDHRGAGAVAPREVAVDGFPVEGADALPRAEDRPADRLVRPGGRAEEIEHEILRRIFDGADFLHNDVLFPFEFAGVELAVGENVADDVHRQSGVCSQHAREVAGSLDPGLRVEVAADILDRLRDVARAPAAGALERHVFNEMREPVLADALVSRACGDEDADRSRLHMGRSLGDYGEPRGEARDLNAHAAARA